MGFSRQEYWSGLPLPSPMHESETMHGSEKWKWSHSVMSDPQWPHGLPPSRLLHPWDFPGKTTGVGCHCLLRSLPQEWEMCSLFISCLIRTQLLFAPCCCSVAQLCPTLSNPINCGLPGSSIHRILQAGVVEWGAIAFSRGSSQPRDWTRISYISCIGRLAGRFFTTGATWDAPPW